MLLIFIVYFLFSKLAENYDKSKVLWGITSSVLYFVFQFIFGFVYGLVLLIINKPIEEDATDIVSPINIFGWIFSALCLVGLYYFLKKRWEKEENQNYINKKNVQNEINDIGKEV